MSEPKVMLFERLYRHFAERRRLLFGGTLLVVALSLFASSRLRLQEDIVAMLPDDGSSAATDFRLLQLAPFTKKLVISLKARRPDDPALVGVADKLAAALGEAGVGKVTTGPAEMGGAFFGFMGDSLPALSSAADLKRLEAATAPPQVRKRLRAGYEQMFAPEGWALKDKLRSDPLSFSDLALEKLRFLNLVPNMRLVRNHFVSADGKSALITVDTTVPMTDSAGSRRLMDRIEAAIKKEVPAGFSATVLSGHRYTLANAETIKRDLYLVLTLSVVAVFAIYVLFLRSMSSVFVFLVPSSVLAIASGALALWTPQVFAVTLGFGGVLLGMVDEYAMMIYFSCRKGGKDPALITAEVARPVLSGALATLLSFGVMLLSVLPGQRQLAIYSMTGIVAALIFSLVVLPHLIRPAPAGSLPFGGLKGSFRLPRRVVIGVWLVLMALCAWQATGIRFNGNLQAISMVPPELKRAEAELATTWGDLQGKALVFSEGKDLESALTLNRRVFERLSAQLEPGDLVSLAPLLPGAAEQRDNGARWISFWQQGRAAKLERDLAREGAALGFSDAAFAPFLATLKTPPAPITVDRLREAGLGELVDALVIREPGSVRVLSMVPDRPEIVDVLERDLKGLPGVHLVSQNRFGAVMGRAIIHDFTRYLGITAFLVLLLVAVVFKNPRRIALVLVPVITGVVCMMGIMGMLGLEFNIFNIAATILIIGLCVDYGIFMVSRLTDGEDRTASLSVLVSGLTTLAGLGALALARHPSMQSIGVTVLLGIGTGIPAALLVIPALCDREAK